VNPRGSEQKSSDWKTAAAVPFSPPGERVLRGLEKRLGSLLINLMAVIAVSATFCEVQMPRSARQYILREFFHKVLGSFPGTFR
jgi:hypothetical protein